MKKRYWWMAACFALSVSGIAAFWFFTADKITDDPQTVENATAQGTPKPTKVKSSPVLGKDIPGLPEYCADKLISVSGCDGITEITTEQGNTYRLVEIGEQCWFADNLKEVPSTDQGWYGYYDDAEEEPAPNEGMLYTWDAAMNGENEERAQGVCPEGWHIPSECDWRRVFKEIGIDRSLASDPSFTTVEVHKAEIFFPKIIMFDAGKAEERQSSFLTALHASTDTAEANVSLSAILFVESNRLALLNNSRQNAIGTVCIKQ